jgi:glycosyltransferase involved in cell wall biosynthesis
MQQKICLIYNFAQHYRAGIFKLLDANLTIDFYFGNTMGNIKKMDYTYLSHFQRELKNISLFSSVYWQKGAVTLFTGKYDKYLLLGEYYCLSTWILLILCFFSKKKTYLWTHGWYGNEGFFKKWIKILFFKLSDGIFLYGDYAKNLMIKQGFDASKLYVIYNSLDYQRQMNIRKKLKKETVYQDWFRNPNQNIIFIGRLTSGKKLSMLLDLLSHLKRKNINLNLIFIGDGEAKEELQLLSRDKENIWFYGACYEEEKIAQLIYNADVCISPGNVGLTAMHSLVYGTPVITHNSFKNQMPEFEAIIKGHTGDFFQYNNIDSLVETTINWLACSKNNRENIRTACFDIIDKKYNPYYQLNIFNEIFSI